MIRPGASAAALATRNRRVGVIATPATIRSHAYFDAIKDENPAVEVYEHATPALVPLVEAGRAGRPGSSRRPSREALAPLLGERDAAGEFVFPLPPRRAIDTLLLGCTHYPLLRPVIAARRRRAASRSSTRRPRPRRRSPSCSAINGLEAPGTTRGTAADPGSDGHDRPRTTSGDAVHLQLTTGDVERVPRPRRAGSSATAFPDVERSSSACAVR